MIIRRINSEYEVDLDGGIATLHHVAPLMADMPQKVIVSDLPIIDELEQDITLNQGDSLNRHNSLGKSVLGHINSLHRMTLKSKNSNASMIDR